MADQPAIAPSPDETVQKLLTAIEAEVAKGEKRSGDKLEALHKELRAEIATVKELAERQANQFRLAGSGDATHKGEKFSFSKLIRALAHQNEALAPLEFEMGRQMKAMATSPDSVGGFIVPTEVMSDQFIPLLYAKLVCAKLGCTTLNNLSAIPTYFPKATSGTTAYWVAEAGAITASDMAFGQITLAPKTLAAMSVYSELLLKTSNPSVEKVVKEDLARRLALKLDLAALKGAGSAGEPTGIINTTGINTSTLTDPATYDELLAFVYEIRKDNALEGSLGWAVSNDDLLEMEQIKDVTGGTDNKSNIQPLGSRTMLTYGGDGSVKLLGYPVEVSTQLADGDVVFGNWADLICGDWGPLELVVSNAPNFANLQINVRSHMFVDIGVRRPESFCKKA